MTAMPLGAVPFAAMSHIALPSLMRACSGTRSRLARTVFVVGVTLYLASVAFAITA